MRKNIFVSLIILALACSPAAALINPNFTPIQLTEQSTAILSLRVAAPEDGELAVSKVTAIKGEAPSEPFKLLVRDDTVMAQLREEAVFYGVDEAEALIFMSAQKQKDGTTKTAASLNLDGIWFDLEATGENNWELLEDPGEMKMAIFNGHTHMLKRCVEYVMESDDPVVPVASGVQWGEAVQIGKAEGAVADCMVVDLTGKGEKTLLVLSDKGDRAFRIAAGGECRDVTRELGLHTSSTAAALADMDGDGILDLVSCTPGRIELWKQTSTGKFADKPVSIAAEDVQSLVAVGLGEKRSAIVAGAAQSPVLYQLTPEGTLAGKPVVDDKPDNVLGTSLQTFAADFDNDGHVDLLQVFTEGSRFFKGTGKGAFAAPQTQAGMYAGADKTRAYTCDLDMDGILDLAFLGTDGFIHWGGSGDGAFNLRYRTGETDYIAKNYSSGGVFGDYTNDGRQDLVIMYESESAHPFFNRGFASMGFAIELDFMKKGFPTMGIGQQAGCFADFTGDGYLDLVVVLKDGSIWLLPVLKGEPGLLAEIVLSPKAAEHGPVAVTARQEDRCLGVQNLTPGRIVSFARTQPGPLLLKYRLGGSTVLEQEVIVEDGPVQFAVPAAEE